MTTIPSGDPVRIHLTNVAGAGASELLQSLLPALENDPIVTVQRIYLPDRGALATYHSNSVTTVTEVYRRYLPNALSRIIECTWLSSRFNGHSPLLVLGDLPLRCTGPQTLFVQQANLLPPDKIDWHLGHFKYVLARAIFRLNASRVRSFIVQTEVMREALEHSYPGTAGRVHVIAQPVPSWLLRSGLNRRARVRSANQGLSLLYPAANYPHKNHALLSRLDVKADLPVERLTLTLDATSHPAPHLTWVHCGGFLSPLKMLEAYSQVDALLFLSKRESYGFPLVEAMFIGLPIICPDLLYARTLCGDEAIYFDIEEPESLCQALLTLQSRLNKGWWPNWRDRLINIPSDWETVARRMLSIACRQANL